MTIVKPWNLFNKTTLLFKLRTSDPEEFNWICECVFVSIIHVQHRKFTIGPQDQTSDIIANPIKTKEKRIECHLG